MEQEIYRSKNPKTFDMKPMHERKIVFSGVDLVGASMSHSYEIYGVIMDEYEKLLISSGYLEHAPFLWIGIMFLYGLKNDKIPKYQRIHKKYGDLSLELELDMRVLLLADANDTDVLREFFEIATLDALIHAGKKYKLPTQILEEKRALLGTIPDWQYDMEEHPELMFEIYERSKP